MKSVKSKEVFLCPDNQLENDLNFKKQIKKNVNNYKYKTVYNVGKTKHSYVLTRNFVIISLEEWLGVEIIVRGSYRPEELNGNVDEENALLLEISAPTPNELQDAMFKLASFVKTIPVFNLDLINSWKYIRISGIQYRTFRFSIELKNMKDGKSLNEFREDLHKIETDLSIEIRIRGKGSGYVESCLDDEDNTFTYVQIIAKNESALEQAKKACQEMIVKYMN